MMSPAILGAESIETAGEMQGRDANPLKGMHLVVLTNYLRKFHVDVLEQVQSRVGKLTVLLSTPIEPDRKWEPVWGDLDVVVQKNWTIVRKWKHSRGFQEDNFIHLPYDTLAQLKRLRPDAVISYELGFRTLMSSFYTRRNQVPLIAVGNMSEAIERERGWARRRLRKSLVSRADCFTYNGPSCRRYLTSLGIPEGRMAPVPYYYDQDKVFRAEKEFSQGHPRRLLYSGNLTTRKGINGLVEAVGSWAEAHPDRILELKVCGDGPEAIQFSRKLPENLRLEMAGACTGEQLAAAYGWADICVFPSLADEWGLVPIESFASGCPVVGSLAAQSLEVYGREGSNGWFYALEDEGGLKQALGRALQVESSDLKRMSQACRATVAGITAKSGADYFCNAVVVGMRLHRQRVKGGKREEIG